MASIVKRKNRYSVVYTYKDDDGNQHQKWETFDTVSYTHLTLPTT